MTRRAALGRPDFRRRNTAAGGTIVTAPPAGSCLSILDYLLPKIATYQKHMGGGASAPVKAPSNRRKDFTEDEMNSLRNIYGHEEMLLGELESTIAEFEDNAGATCSSLSSLKERLGGNMEELSDLNRLDFQDHVITNTLKLCKDIRQKSLEKLGAVCCSDSVSPDQRTACKNEVVRVLNLVRQLRSSIKMSELV